MDMPLCCNVLSQLSQSSHLIGRLSTVQGQIPIKLSMHIPIYYFSYILNTLILEWSKLTLLPALIVIHFAFFCVVLFMFFFCLLD